MSTWMRKFFETDSSWAMLAARLGLGGVFVPHGAQKLLGWFGGPGLSATLDGFGKMGMPWPFSLLVILGESVGALMLIAGAGTRLAAFGIGAIMAGAIAMAHWPNGFFMNWYGNQAGEGFEYHLLAIALAAGLAIAGGGRASIDRRIAARFRA